MGGGALCLTRFQSAVKRTPFVADTQFVADAGVAGYGGHVPASSSPGLLGD